MASRSQDQGNNIEGKVVIVTGASSGLGEAAARLLSAQGASVVLGARRADRPRSLADGDEIVMGNLSRRGVRLRFNLVKRPDADEVPSDRARIVRRSAQPPGS
jgi:NAD(P)-dependent dehydrogenase (short-subunit alcohol dehydrogenase family)